MALDFPNSPTIGDEFTGGGFTWVWTGSSWDKLMASVTAGGGQGFSLVVGASGNTTYTFAEPQPAGAYSITSKLDDTTFDIYLVTADNQNAGYTNTPALEATAEFDRVVLYGSATDDIFVFEFKPSASPATSGDVVDGAAPFLTSATPATLASIDDTTTVTGGNFASDVEIVFTGQDDVDRTAKSIVRNSSTELIVTRPDVFPAAQEPFTMTATNAGITNPSVTVNKLTDFFDAGSGIVWVTTSPLPGAFADAAYSTTLEATDADATSVGYAVTAGSLPTGLSLAGSTGVISGTPTTEETQTFTITATDAGGNSSAREFTLSSVIVAAYLVVAGGGASGLNGFDNGGGGAGGYRSSVADESSGGGGAAETPLTISTGPNYTITVGAGGSITSSVGTPGSNSVFHTVTSLGGGGGAPYTGPTPFYVAGNGGSGGGGSRAAGSDGNGTAGQGFNGGLGAGNRGGGGGGAAAVGGNATNNGSAGAGGAGVASSITGSSITRATGGTGNNSGTTAAANTGNGGGSGGQFGNGNAGGSGVVILKYTDIITITIGAGLTGSTTTVGANKVTTITAGTGNVSWAA